MDIRGHTLMGRDAARGMLFNTFRQNVLIYWERTLPEGKINFSRVQSFIKGFIKATYCQTETYCQNEMHRCRGPGASSCWPYRHYGRGYVNDGNTSKVKNYTKLRNNRNV